jgi:hypothetical protein
VVVALDDTLERRRRRRIRARGIYRDPVRSSHGHFVKASGLRWLSLMLVVPVPWAGRAWALPFLTVLAPSERSARERGGRHKRLTNRARQALLRAARWLPGRRVVAVADSSFAAALVHKSADGRGAAAIAAFQAVRCDTGMPSRVIRLSTEQATLASVFWAGRVRTRRLRPMMVLYRNTALSPSERLP